jgi:uncharacterized protein (DUF2267 family)
MTLRDELVEELAARLHAQWTDIVRAVYRDTELVWIAGNPAYVVVPSAVDRREQLAKTPYAELPDDEKQKDRDHAEELMPVIAEAVGRFFERRDELHDDRARDLAEQWQSEMS